MSDLPSLDISKDILLDKLELFFSKTKNGGSEVESREFLDDSGQVVLTFTKDGGVWGVLSLGGWQGWSSPTCSGGKSPERRCLGNRQGRVSTRLSCPPKTVLAQVS